MKKVMVFLAAILCLGVSTQTLATVPPVEFQVELDDAKSLADELASTDVDNHHGYDVIPVPLDDHYEITKSSSGNGTEEDVAVYSATKQT